MHERVRKECPFLTDAIGRLVITPESYAVVCHFKLQSHSYRCFP